jgi:hypothetical protein
MNVRHLITSLTLPGPGILRVSIYIRCCGALHNIIPTIIALHKGDRCHR